MVRLRRRGQVSTFATLMLLIPLGIVLVSLSNPREGRAPAVSPDRPQVAGGSTSAATRAIGQPAQEPASFWTKVSDQPAPFLAVAGAVFAALVSLVTFGINLHSTQRTQRNTEFYEALKRFGDKDSPGLRCGACHLIARMAVEHRRYFNMALGQLAAGFQLEGNLAVLNSIHVALRKLIPVDPQAVIEELHHTNKMLQEQLVLALADCFAAWGIGDHEDLQREDWNLVARAGSYDSDVLRGLAMSRTWIRCFSERLTLADSSETHQSQRPETCERVRIAAAQLRANVDTSADVIRDHRLPNFDLRDMFLAEPSIQKAHLDGANLSGCCLQGADLRSASLNSANLSGGGLERTMLHGAKLDQANLDDSNWWQADYWDDDQNVDTRLLQQLFGRYESSMPSDPRKVHFSVLHFNAQRKQGEIVKILQAA